MEWSRHQVLRLVDLYHSQPALWDTSDPRFKDRQAKRWSLMTIASQMSLPPIDIEKKIHCLRTQFNREYLKMKTSARRPTWFAYQPLTFVLRNKQDVPDDVAQWKSGSMITVKEEFLQDEYDPDDVEMRLTIDENPNMNFMMKVSHDNEPSSRNDSPTIINDDTHNSSSNAPNSNSNSHKEKDSHQDPVVLSDNEIETSSAVQVILREEPNEDHQISYDHRQQNKRFCKINNNSLFNTHNDFTSVNSKIQLQNQRFMTNNGNNNTNYISGISMNSHNHNNIANLPGGSSSGLDELAMFGRLLTDELLKVIDYYTLQLAKYEISKIIFKATTGGYESDKTSKISCDDYIDDIWKNNKKMNDVDDVKTSIGTNRMSSPDELKTFSTVVINELRTITNNYSLQVAKFQINRVIFHATTAGIGPCVINSSPSRSKSPPNLTNDDKSSSHILLTIDDKKGTHLIE